MAISLAAANLGNALIAALVFMLATIAAVGGFYVARAVKRWMRRDQGAEAFTMQDIRDMKARGEITEAEFQAMRGAILGSAVTKLQSVPPASEKQSPKVPNGDTGEDFPGLL